MESTLRAILDVDPEHEEAKNLLSLVSSLQSVSHQPVTLQSIGQIAGGATATGRRGRIWAALGLLALLIAGGALWFKTSSPTADNRVAALSKGNDVQGGQVPTTAVVPPEKGSLTFFIVPATGARVSLNRPSDGRSRSVELKPARIGLRFTADCYQKRSRKPSSLANAIASQLS